MYPTVLNVISADLIFDIVFVQITPMFLQSEAFNFLSILCIKILIVFTAETFLLENNRNRKGEKRKTILLLYKDLDTNNVDNKRDHGSLFLQFARKKFVFRFLVPAVIVSLFS